MTITCQGRNVSDKNCVVSKQSRCKNFLIFGLSIQESMWPKEIPKNDLEAGSNRDKGRSAPPCMIQGGSALGNNRWGPRLLQSPHAAGETRLSPASSYSILSSHSLGTFRVQSQTSMFPENSWEWLRQAFHLCNCTSRRKWTMRYSDFTKPRECGSWKSIQKRQNRPVRANIVFLSQLGSVDDLDTVSISLRQQAPSREARSISN